MWRAAIACRPKTARRPRAVRRRFELEAQAVYEIDWLGRNTFAVAGARAQSMAAEHDAAAARIALICAVVEAYADIALAEQQAALADAQAGLAGEAEAAEQRRLLAGLTNQRALRGRQDVWSRTALAADDASRQRKQAVDRLALLLGQPAHHFAAPAVSAAVLEQALALQADQPADVIGRRPDVLAAWQRLLAATADAERAHLERYPRITLSAGSGLLSEAFSRWLRRDALGWVLGVRANASLFDGGRQQAQANQAQALSQERQAEYRKTVLTALQEAESAFVQFEFTRASAAQAAAATQRRQADERNVRSELAAGRTSRVVMLDAGRATLEARDELLRAQRAHLQSYVLLRRVLADGA